MTQHQRFTGPDAGDRAADEILRRVVAASTSPDDFALADAIDDARAHLDRVDHMERAPVADLAPLLGARVTRPGDARD